MCRKLGVQNRWEVVNPSGKNGGLLVFWSDKVQVYHIIKSDFCMELEIEGDDFEGKCWIVFLYASTDIGTMKMLWDILLEMKKLWNMRWVLGGDFNEIVALEDKQGGIRRGENSFCSFRSFIRNMKIEKIRFKGRRWTWQNN